MNNKIVVITGGSRGIGRATALLLARAGADVAFTFHTRAAEAEAVAAEIRALGRRTAAFGGDLSDPAVVSAMIAGVTRAFGRVDYFVANAGIWPPEEVPLGELAPERWRATMAANLDAVYLTTKAALGAVVMRVPTMTDFDNDPLEQIETGDWVRIDADQGTVSVWKGGRPS